MGKRNSNANGHDADFTPLTDAVMPYLEKEVADCAGSLNEAVQVGEGQGSMSMTIHVKRGKAGHFKCTIKTRVRSPRPPIELDFHIDKRTKQLAFGFNPTEHGTGEEEGESAGAGQ